MSYYPQNVSNLEKKQHNSVSDLWCSREGNVIDMRQCTKPRMTAAKRKQIKQRLNFVADVNFVQIKENCGSLYVMYWKQNHLNCYFFAKVFTYKTNWWKKKIDYFLNG